MYKKAEFSELLCKVLKKFEKCCLLAAFPESFNEVLWQETIKKWVETT